MDPLKPQDVLIALKYASQPKAWQRRELATSIGISPGEINNGIHRLAAARLFNLRDQRVIRPSLLEFIVFGVPYAFPAQLEFPSVGMPTAFSAKPLVKQLLGGDTVAVWESELANVRGLGVQPLWKSAPEAARRDAVLYEYLALVDALRVGRARERALAKDELAKRLAH